MTDSGFLGSGWSFPPTFEPSTGEMNLAEGVDNINQSIDIILQTRCGEQGLNPAFGSTLHRSLFQPLDFSLKSDITDAVRNALLEFEPRIEVEAVHVDLIRANTPRAEVTIDYRVRTTNSRHNHVYPFALTEGTNLTDVSTE